MQVSSPKRVIPSKASNGIYNYYAGYSESFVRDIIKKVAPPKDSILLDPWNGSGTTTYIANGMGLNSFGYDINPVMVIVAKAKLLKSSVCGSLASLGYDILKKADNSTKYCDSKEPLFEWFREETAQRIRNIEIAIQELLISPTNHRQIATEKSLDFLSSLAAFYYVALFRCIRMLLKGFMTSNPTWIKSPSSSNDRIDVDKSIIDIYYLETVMQIEEYIAEYHNCQSSNINSYINLSSSTGLPLTNNSVHSIVSSPPYCTRIDYVIATKPELAILGCGFPEGIASLRKQMIGTPTITGVDFNVSDKWGKTCNRLLKQIYDHESKASKTYYYKTYTQYFNSMYHSLKEIDRVSVTDGKCVLVVQDSYYKEIYIDLAQIITELMNQFNWQETCRNNFNIQRTLAGVNSKVKRYRNNIDATETVLLFTKA